MVSGVVLLGQETWVFWLGDNLEYMPGGTWYCEDRGVVDEQTMTQPTLLNIVQ
jgi:hypothetical protein